MESNPVALPAKRGRRSGDPKDHADRQGRLSLPAHNAQTRKKAALSDCLFEKRDSRVKNQITSWKQPFS